MTCDRLVCWMTGDECINICFSKCHYVVVGPLRQFKQDNYRAQIFVLSNLVSGTRTQVKVP
jgi:hypothetical protein